MKIRRPTAAMNKATDEDVRDELESRKLELEGKLTAHWTRQVLPPWAYLRLNRVSHLYYRQIRGEVLPIYYSASRHG